VAELQLVAEIARRTGRPIGAADRLEALRLHSPITPGQVVHVELAHDAERGTLGFRILDEDRVAVEGRFETDAGVPD